MIRETAALTTRELSNEEQRITASSAGARAQDETNYVTEDVWLAALISHGLTYTKFLLSHNTATLFHNLFDCPVESIPVTHIDPELDVLPKDWSTTTSSNTPLPKSWTSCCMERGGGTTPARWQVDLSEYS
ncbi:hypothetical protein BDM02DRAFT_3119329, partial [Thelephora ganbajun]